MVESHGVNTKIPCILEWKSTYSKTMQMIIHSCVQNFAVTPFSLATPQILSSTNSSDTESSDICLHLHLPTFLLSSLHSCPRSRGCLVSLCDSNPIVAHSRSLSSLHCSYPPTVLFFCSHGSFAHWQTISLLSLNLPFTGKSILRWAKEADCQWHTYVVFLC